MSISQLLEYENTCVMFNKIAAPFNKMAPVTKCQPPLYVREVPSWSDILLSKQVGWLVLPASHNRACDQKKGVTAGVNTLEAAEREWIFH